MFYSIAAAAAILASANVAIAETTCGTQAGWGSATITNKCDSPVLIRAVPGGGNPGQECQETDEQTIASGKSYHQQYVGLINGGWSLKAYLSASDNATLQFEYNTQTDFNGGANGGVLWWDVSAVNGNPWSGNWALETDRDDCVPNLYAYACSEDNFKSMQKTCSLSTHITLNLCEADSSTPHVGAAAPGGDGQALACPAGRGGIMPTQEGVSMGSGSAANTQAASSYVAPTSAAAPSTTSAAAAPQSDPASPASSSEGLGAYQPVQKDAVNNQQAPSPVVPKVIYTHVETKTEIAMVIETVMVDAKKRRDAHMRVHAHHRRAL